MSRTRHRSSMPARTRACKGAALLPCTLLLLIVLMLLTALLTTSRNRQSLAQTRAGREIARHAAEAALIDGQRHLMMSDDPLSSTEFHHIGSITGVSFPVRPGMQSAAAPVYRIERAGAAGSRDIWRITATGWGTSEAIQISLQADYARSPCEAPADAQVSCVLALQALAWRELGDD